jgi:two-component system sensor histidine kinase SenX3
MQPVASARGIELRVAVARDASDAVLYCDRHRISSAIQNLIDNAIKYSDDGKVVEVHGYRTDDDFEFAVHDEGIGIPKRDRERIFERFYRVDQARSRATGGTGLGLAIVRHVVQSHGGEVTVESTEGEGSTFRLSLPLGDPEEASLLDTSND